MIIECKTWGEEFEKEKNKMEEHGGQLFSYLNQDKNAQFLVLYASKFENNIFKYNNLIVRIKDRKEDLEKTLKQVEEENIKRYRDAKNKGELFEVWKESFNKYFHFNGIFDADANAYSLELKALKKKDLKHLEDSTGLFNKFAEILRHNNISDNANAFNRVLSLFLCKIVDEEKSDDDILEFQVKEDEEYEGIIDRLQALYQRGMEKLKEKIIYYSEEDLQQNLKTIDTANLSVEVKEKVNTYLSGTHWASKYIFGIEKDYRLARTSQIACYINGDGDANIIFGDGLEELDRLKLDQKKFNVIIANPPNSVEAFKNYLNVGKTHFDLLASHTLSERSSQIEVLFIERTKQVLADGGLAGIILPSTILSNSGIYTKAREILLKYFEIKAITELGSKTFITTGITTVILFLKRRNSGFLNDRINVASDFFNHTRYEINYRYIDSERFLKMFVEHRGFDLKDYKHFLIVEIYNNLANTEMFKEYHTAFENSTTIKQLKRKAYFIHFTEEEKVQEMNKRFYEYCKTIEEEKFIYFMLCLGDGQKNIATLEDYYKYQQTVIVKTGRDIHEQKEYLGYEFQGKKGSEGLRVLNYGGNMFDDSDYENPNKANSYIRKAIQNIGIDNIAPTQEKNIFAYNLVDLIDFNQVAFEKNITVNFGKKFKIESKWELVKLGDVAEIKSGGTPDTKDKNNWNGSINWATLVDTKEKYLYSTKRKITEQGLKNIQKTFNLCLPVLLPMKFQKLK